MAANIQHSSESQEWYTPSQYIELVRQVFHGDIDLDPASSIEANYTVQAKNIFVKGDDTLNLHWWGKVFLNMPYGQGVTGAWVAKMIKEYQSGRVTEAIMLTNNATGTQWFQMLWPYSICFVKGRIKFRKPAGVPNNEQPSHSQVFVYMGLKPYVFENVFSQVGHVIHPVTLAYATMN